MGEAAVAVSHSSTVWLKMLLRIILAMNEANPNKNVVIASNAWRKTRSHLCQSLFVKSRLLWINSSLFVSPIKTPLNP